MAISPRGRRRTGRLAAVSAAITLILGALALGALVLAVTTSAGPAHSVALPAGGTLAVRSGSDGEVVRPGGAQLLPVGARQRPVRDGREANGYVRALAEAAGFTLDVCGRIRITQYPARPPWRN